MKIDVNSVNEYHSLKSVDKENPFKSKEVVKEFLSLGHTQEEVDEMYRMFENIKEL